MITPSGGTMLKGAGSLVHRPRANDPLPGEYRNDSGARVVPAKRSSFDEHRPLGQKIPY